MKATLQPQASGQNEVYTYVVLPLEALQQTTDHGVQSLTVAQNVILKALPDGNITQQIQPITVPENVIFRTLSKGTKKNTEDQILNGASALIAKPMEKEKQSVPAKFLRLSVIEENNSRSATVGKSVILKSGLNKSENILGRSGLRYLKCKSSQINNVGYTKTRNSQSGSFKCTICDQVFHKMMLYRAHMQAHRNTKKFKCDECSASYNVEDNLKLHMAMHTRGEPTCPICNRKFQRLASLKAHIIIHEVDEIFMCVECLAEYDKEEDLNRHVETHKKENTESTNENSPLECSFCSHTFQDANQYKEHISFHIKIKRMVMNGKKHKRRVNTNRDYPYKCEVCKKSFAKYCLLERHMRIHSGEKPFTCHLCDRAFNQKGTLQIHLARHSGLKPFQCTLCPAKFCQKGNLRVHVQKTHIAPGPGEKIYKCTMCTCIFKKVSSLNAHITRAHAGDKQDDDIADVLEQLKQLEKRLETSNDKVKTETSDISSIQTKEQSLPEPENSAIRYVRLVDTSVEGSIRRFLVKQRKIGDSQWYICSCCSKEFKKPSDLIRHIRVHTREKPYKCKYCDQAFSLKSTLTTHMTTHIGKRQYQCVLCSKSFTSVRSLNAHLRRHEKRSQHYMCSTCNTVFNTISKAKMHMELHKSDPLHGELAKAGELRVVMQQPMVETANGLLPVAAPKSQIYSTKTDSSKTRPHKCHYCSAAFTKGVHLKRHMLIHSGEKKFKCNMCSKSFYSSYALKEHLQFHSGERNYSCKVCGKKFVTNAILKRHLTIHNSTTPYVCPYCRKRFKTIMLCRRHIKIHKRDFSIQIQALTETGELGSLDDADTTSSLDLNDALVENPFSTTLVDTASDLELPLETLSPSSEIPATLGLVETSSSLSAASKPEGTKDLQQIKNSDASKVLYTDENGIIISANLENQSQDELQSVLGTQFYQTAIPQNFVDRNTRLALLSEARNTNDVGNVEDVIPALAQENFADESVCGPTVYINCDDLQNFTTASLYNACLAQLKNNDPLLMSGINEIQDPNFLFSTDSTLNQIADTQMDPQAFEMLMPTFTLYNNMAVPTNSLGGLNASFPNIILSNIEDYSDTNQAVLPSINEINKKAEVNLFNALNNMVPTDKASEVTDTQILGAAPSTVELNDDSIVNMNQENAILSNLLYSSSNQLDTNSSMSSDAVKICFDSNTDDCTENLTEPQILSAGPYKQPEFNCTFCKVSFKNMVDLQTHKCVEKSNSSKRKRKGRIQIARARQKIIVCPAKTDASWGTSVLKSNNPVKSVLNEAPVSDPPTVQVPDACVPNKCAHCEKVFATKNALSRHVLVHKEKKGSGDNICSYCSKIFKKRSDLERHLRTHTGEKPYGCDKCGKSFSLKSTLDSHYRTHNPGGNKDFSCAVCSSYFSSKSSLRVHMLMHTGAKPYQCTLCPEKFRTPGHRKSHMSSHLKNKDSKKNCQSKAAKLNSLLASVVMDSQNISQDTQEKICLLDNVGSSGENKKISSEIILPESDKDILYTSQTIQVDPLLLQQLQLNNVLLQDTSDDLSFVQVDINNEGQITNMKPFLTNAADISNFDQPLYETVITEKTKPEGVSYFSKKNAPLTKEFVCDVCNKKYSTKSVLTKHKKIHANTNMFKCTKCSTTFNSEEELDNHLKLHSGYRPFCCQLCANTFTQEKNLKTHMKRIHGIVIQE